MPDNRGKISPFTSSSSQHEEADDSSLDYYVKGGDNMTEDDTTVTEAADDSYEANASCEPDPNGEIAMQKATDQQDDDNDSDSEPDDDADDKVKKSIWGNAFAPGIPNSAVRAVFRMED